MKKVLFILIIFSLTCSLLCQEGQLENAERDIEIPVRVFIENRFLDDLTIQDFEIYENGTPQKIEALYLVNENKIVRQQELKDYSPQTSRNYYFLFHATEYDPKLQKSIGFFFKNVILRGDSFLLITPQKKNYFLSSEALGKKPRELVSKDMLKILKKDIKISSSAYRSSMRSLKSLVRAISSRGGVTSDLEFTSEFESELSSLSTLLRRYRMNLSKMEELRIMDQNLLLQFANRLKKTPGRNYVYFFYEREFRPELSLRVMSAIESQHHKDPGIMADMQDLFQFYRRDEKIDIDRIKQAFADAGVCFNFLFTNRESKSSPGIYMREQSEDFFKAFTEVARTTGGVIHNSQNPSAALMKAINMSENYYLLYYSPLTYKASGEFNEIEVRVKNRDCKITHRQGYYAKDSLQDIP